MGGKQGVLWEICKRQIAASVPQKQGMWEQAVKPGGVQERRPCNDLSQYYFHLYFAQTKGKYQINAFCLLSVICVEVITKTM